MIDDALTKRIAQLQVMQVQIHEHHRAILQWCANAKNTRQHRDAITLFFKGQDLEKALMDELLKTSTEATMLRTTLHEQALGTLSQETCH